MRDSEIPTNPESQKLTHIQRHTRLLKKVRREYQHNNPGSRLWNNKSGWAWQGTVCNNVGSVTLINPSPIWFGIPEPEPMAKVDKSNSSGGADLLGFTIKNNFPIFTAIEGKTGNAKLQKNQKIFRDHMISVHGIYYLARECTCWDKWVPVWLKKKIIRWAVPHCDQCDGVGYLLEE